MTDRRRDIATAATGGGLLAGGGAMRHAGVSLAYPKGKPKIHAAGMFRAPRGKKLFWAGSALGLVGLPPLAVGTTHAIRGDVDKAAKIRTNQERADRMVQSARRAHAYGIEQARLGNIAGVRRANRVRNARSGRAALLYSGMLKKSDEKKPFWREGISGSKDALRQRVDTVSQPVPTKLRALQFGIGAGTGAVGSLAARAALGRRGDALKPLLTPIAGGLAATGSVPLSNKAIRHRYPSYEVTAAGVRRRKTDRKLPSTKSSRFQPQSRSFRQDVGKAAKDERYLGARTPYYRQRAAITAAGHPPVIGPFTASATAARYAPPGQKRKQAARQYALGSAVGIPVGVAGAYGGAKLANHSASFHRTAGKIVNTKDRLEGKARRAVGLKETKGGPMARATGRFLESKHGEPFRTPRGKVGGAAGFLAGKMVTGGVLGQTAISLNQRDQRRYNARHHIEKRRQPDKELRRANLATMQPSDRQIRYQGTPNKAYVNRKVVPPSDFGDYEDLSMRGFRVHSEIGRRTSGETTPWEKLTGAYKTRQVGWGGRVNTPAWLISDYVPTWKRPRVRGGAVALAAGGAAVALRRKHKKRPVQKFDPGGRGQSKREKHVLAQRKRRSASLSTVGGTLGLGSLGLLAAGKRQPALTAGTIGSGLGGLNALLGARVQRQEAHVVDPVKKGFRDIPRLWHVQAEAPKYFIALGKDDGLKKIRHGKPVYQFEGTAIYRFHPKKLGIDKAAPLAITGSDREHHDAIRRYGDRGPLPKGLSREERMKAYEARYVHHGGDHQNRWSRRAKLGDRAKNVGLGVATGGTAAWLATRGRRTGAALAKHPRLRHHAETVTGLGAVAGGAGEMYSGYAHRKQSSYANSPGGVAASALRRMRENTPEGQVA